MTARTYDAVLCDLDGVIRHYDHGEVHRLEAIAGITRGTTMELAFAPERDLPLLLGQVSRAQWAASIANALTTLTTRAQAEQLAQEFAHAPSCTDQATVELIRDLRKRVPVVLVTNATVWLDDDLAALGLTDLADDVVNSSIVQIAKPDPRIYAIAADRARVPVERCLFIDDSQINVDSARVIGMAAVHYRCFENLYEAVTPLLTGLTQES
ncbi:HAD family hydrolase [Nocardia iowensis]|uniref:HAD-IA family hydrolase n=1 Tax=Nocardia iowensis TaxID=204891 RepID=A0ABX8RQJ7_NOCIO|nr:HAD-IA family hydrolase [Nocardia iowensis]QXN91915.1 HAD-IA family hydrolase [Nocardia iowensis]